MYMYEHSKCISRYVDMLKLNTVNFVCNVTTIKSECKKKKS